MNHTLAAALTAAAVVWAATILAAPFAMRSPSAAAPGSILYAASSRICHQRPERSFAIGGIQMPVCARCTGLYLSGACGAAVAWIGRRGTRLRTRRALIVAALPTAIAYALEHFAGMRVSNLVRAVAALPLGGVAAWLFVRMLRYDSRLHAFEDAHR